MEDGYCYWCSGRIDIVDPSPYAYDIGFCNAYCESMDSIADAFFVWAKSWNCGLLDHAKEVNRG